MPGSTTEAAAVAFAWVDRIDCELMAQIRALINAALDVDDIIGFPAPIANDAPTPYLDYLKADIETARRRLLLGRDHHGQVMAMAVVTRSPLPNCEHLAEVSKCIIHPAHRGRGILRSGVDHLLAECRRCGIEVLTLDVRRGTRAEALWGALGFRPFGVLPDYARTHGQVHAGVYLWAPVEELTARRRAH